MNEKESSLLVGWKQIAAYLHCAQSTARRQAREKGLPVFRVGGSVRALAADIDRWLEAQPRAEAAAGEGEEPRALILEGDDLPTALSSLGGRAAKLRYALIPLGVKEAEFARIQELLQSAEEKYQRLVEQVPVWIWETDGAGEFTYSNPRSFEILGYEAGDFAGFAPTEFAVAPEDAERFERSFAAVRESGSIMKGFRCRFVHRDGSRRWLETDAEPAFAADGSFAAVRGVSRDVTAAVVAEDELRQHRDRLEELVAARTAELQEVNVGLQREIAERERAERALEEQRNRLRMIFTVTPDLLVLLDRDFVYRAVNPAFCHFTGKREEELLGRTDFDVFPRPEAEVYRRSDEEVLASGELHILEREASDADGTTRWLQVAKAPIFGAAGAGGLLVSARDITTQKGIEAALRESEEKYRFLINSADFPIMFFDTDLKLALMNRSGARNLRGKPEDFIGKALPELLPEMAESIAAQLRRIIASGKSEEAEDKVALPSGERWFWSNLHCVRNTAGEKMGVLVISHDITARRQAERAIKYHTKALRESEEKYRDLFENANDLIQSVTPEGRFVYVNRAWKETLSYNDDEVQDISLFDIIHPASRTHCREVFERVIGGERVDNVEAVFVAKNGREVIVEGSASCRFEKGEPVSTRGIFRDVTARKRAAEELRESEARLRRIIETAGEGVWLIDRDGKTTFANEQMARMLGCDLDEFLAGHLYDFMDEEGRALAAAYMERRREGIREQHDFRFRPKDDSTVWALLETAPIFDADGEFDGALAMVTDITERKQAEERLRASEERLRALFELSAEAIIVLDPRSIVVDVNRRFSDWLGFEAAEVVDKKIADVPFAVAEEKAKTEAALRRRFRGEVVPPYELTLVTKSGEERRGKVRGDILRNEKGEPIADLVMIKALDDAPAEAPPADGLKTPP